MEATEAGEAAEAAEAPARIPRIRARLRRELTLPRLLLLLVAAVAATAYAWSIDTSGLETYYAAGVRSMSGSWHALWFGAFDPDAHVTMDKLPGAFWVQALSVRVFGYSVWALVLPQVVESTLTVLVLYRAVRRTAGTAAALIAAAVLAVSPVTISSTRGNLSEPFYLLCLVLAADAVLRAVVRQRWRPAFAAAGWVALGFQAKMAEAWLVLPVLLVVLVAGAAARRWRATALAGLVGLVAVALSLVWMCAFALTPAAERPVVDGSSNNSIFEQVFVYNAGVRLNSSLDFGLKPLAAPSAHARQAYTEYVKEAREAGVLPPSSLSRPSWDRLFIGVLAPDCAWFIPAAVVGAVGMLVARRRAGRGDPARAGALLWTLWLLLYGVAFSASYLVHDYYLATLVPALAALTGLGVSALWRSARAGRRAGRVVLPVLIAVQAVWCAVLLPRPGMALWGPVLAVGALAAVGAAVLPGRRPELGRSRLRTVPVAVLGLVAALAGPVIADAWLLAGSGGPFDTPFAAIGTLARPSPAALRARAAMPGGYGGSLLAETTPARWHSITAFGANIRQDQPRGTVTLVYSSAAAADLVMGGATEILPIGGYTGNLPYPTARQLRTMIENHQVTLAVLPGPDVLSSNDPRVEQVRALCRLEPAGSRASTQIYACRV